MHGLGDPCDWKEERRIPSRRCISGWLLSAGYVKDGMNDFSTETLTACGSGKIGVRYGRRDVRFLLAAFRPDSGLMAGRKELSHLLPYSSLEKRTGACEAYACAGGYTAASLRHWTPRTKQTMLGEAAGISAIEKEFRRLRPHGDYSLSGSAIGCFPSG